MKISFGGGIIFIMRKVLFNIFLLIAGIGLFVWALKITDLSKVVSHLNKLGPIQFLIIFIILFGGEIIIGSLRWRYILKNHGQKPPFLKTLFSKTICCAEFIIFSMLKSKSGIFILMPLLKLELK